jgi:hypothetical protein
MKTYLATTSLLCLLASPALAEDKFQAHRPPAASATATGTGVGIANSSSQSGAIAISGQGGQGGSSSSSLTINTPANTTSTVNQNLSGTTTSNVNQNLSGTTTQNVNQNLSGTTTQNVNSNVSGTTTSNVNQNLSGATTSNVNQHVSGSSRVENVVSGTQTLKNVPGTIAPGLTAAGLETCLGSASGGASVVGFGATFGTTVPDPGCQARLDARTLWAMGLKGAAVARLCIREDIYRAMPDICTRYTPVVTPQGYAAGPVSTLMSASTDAAPMEGTSIEVIDGKTGITRPCSDYNAVRQKCLNWADAAPKRVRVAARPKRAVVAAVKPVPAVAAINAAVKKEAPAEPVTP